MSKPVVSVVLPYYNAAPTLERAAVSILHQNYTSLELILVDNQSTDHSRIVAEKLAKTDSRVRLLTEPAKGVAYAANTGMKAAKGKYIARMDADDFSHPDRIGLQVGWLDHRPGTGVVSCLVNHVGHHSKTEGIQRFVNWTNTLVDSADILKGRFVESPVINPTVMFRSELLGLHGNFRHGDFPEDYELWLRWLDAGVVVEKIPEVLFDWYDSDTRLTRTDPRYRIEAFYQIKSFYLAKWIKAHVSVPVWVWGAGRLTRKRVQMLIDKGIQLSGFIDIKNYKVEKYPCINNLDFDFNQPCFIISYVAKRGAREIIGGFLVSKGKKEGVGFVMVG